MKGKLDIVRTREGDGGSASDGAGRGERLRGRNTASGRQAPQYSQDRGQLIVGHLRFPVMPRLIFCCPGGPDSVS